MRVAAPPPGLPAFPKRFAWGAATSAYQVEGSPLADGAGPSNWHRFTHSPGRVLTGETGDVACDHYRRWRDDVALMRELGLTAYRFSVSWSRVLPEGTGRVNPKGLDFYRRLVDGLREAGIAPFVTLFHWDLPAALDDRGGWLNRDIAGWFADYAEVMFRALDDRVAWWATLNEPWVVADGGYLHGTLAPGHASAFEAPIASHNLLRAHAAALQAYRAAGRHEIGLVVNLEPKAAASSAPADLAAAARSDAYMNRQFLDPVFLGGYPDELAEVFGEAWPSFPAADLAAIRQRIDFLGVNYYTRGVMQPDPAAWPLLAGKVTSPDSVYTEMDWEVYPQGLFDALAWVTERYGEVPIYITENGAAFADRAAADGTVSDPLRTAYLRDHLLAANAAVRSGVDLRGYFVWSLLDNLEWNQGTSKRFGIVRVDFATQRRTPKASARFYAEVIRTGGAALAAPAG
ncbi:MAG: GH1 family beta-glucosidase [Thermoanaerobaculaceae bacterium]|nr:GH1 family beta-glucosidase [Thermoanaerobaculaceae bacterium]TAM46206.1 MAG: beta-glucosidase [Acidobacteriota bacterium]